MSAGVLHHLMADQDTVCKCTTLQNMPHYSRSTLLYATHYMDACTLVIPPTHWVCFITAVFCCTMSGSSCTSGHWWQQHSSFLSDTSSLYSALFICLYADALTALYSRANIWRLSWCRKWYLSEKFLWSWNILLYFDGVAFLTYPVLALFSTFFMVMQFLSWFGRSGCQPLLRACQPAKSELISEEETQMQLGLALRESSLSFWLIAFVSTFILAIVRCATSCWRRSSQIAITRYDAMEQPGHSAFFHFPIPRR